MYITPNCSTDYYDQTLQYLSSLTTNNDLVIVGDLNCPDINWQTMTGYNPFTSSLCSLFFVKNLIQLITDPTLIHGNILDLVVTNVKQRISNIKVDSASCLNQSDHFLITFNLHLTPPKQTGSKTHSILNYKRADLSGLALRLLDMGLLQPSSGMTSNIDHMWSHLKTKLLCEIEAFVPTINNETIRKQFSSLVYS